MLTDLPQPRSRTVIWGAALSALGLSALAFGSTDTLLRLSFDRALSEAPVSWQAGRQFESTAAVPVAASESAWLGETPTHLTVPGQGLARTGDRMSITVEGGRKLELEVVAVSDITANIIHVDTHAAAPRLVMLTCREIGDAGRVGRIVRFIVEADDASPSQADKSSARAL